MYDISKTIDLEKLPLNGGILVKILVLSIDPYLRRMMIGPDVQNFSVSRMPSVIFLTAIIIGLIRLCDSPHFSSDNRMQIGCYHYIYILADHDL